MVTTPQEVALADVEKGMNMFKNKDISKPVIGVENMSCHPRGVTGKQALFLKRGQSFRKMNSSRTDPYSFEYPRKVTVKSLQ